MPKFSLSWERIGYSPWANPEEFKVESGMLIIEADSLEAVESEIKKFEGVECSMDQRIYVRQIIEYQGSEEVLPLESIGKLMDPWGIRIKS